MEPKDNIQKLIDEKSMEFRDFRLANIEARKKDDGNDEELILEGVPCTFNQETVLYKGQYYEYREVIAPGAFDECDMSDVIFNFNHCGRVFARTRNKSLELSVETDGLHMSATMRKDDRGHEELYNDIKDGLIDKMSFAFTVEESKYEYIERENEPTIEIRTITKINKLYDVSAVDIPAYDSTSISARSVFDAERERRDAESKRIAEKELELEKCKYEYCQI